MSSPPGTGPQSPADFAMMIASLVQRRCKKQLAPPAPGTNAARYHLRHPFPLGPTKLHRAANPARQRDLQHIVGGNGRGGLETELELSTDRKGD